MNFNLKMWTKKTGLVTGLSIATLLLIAAFLSMYVWIDNMPMKQDVWHSKFEVTSVDFYHRSLVCMTGSSVPTDPPCSQILTSPEGVYNCTGLTNCLTKVCSKEKQVISAGVETAQCFSETKTQYVVNISSIETCYCPYNPITDNNCVLNITKLQYFKYEFSFSDGVYETILSSIALDVTPDQGFRNQSSILYFDIDYLE